MAKPIWRRLPVALLFLLNSIGALGDTLQADAMRKLYDTLFGAYHKDDHTFVAIASPGLPINPADYANAYSPDNPTGNKYACERFSYLCNTFPGLDAIFDKRGTVDGYYSYLTKGESIVGNTTVAKDLADAKSEFEASRLPSLDTPGAFYHPCFPEPSNWYDVVSDTWSTVNVTFHDLNSTESSFDSFGGGQRFSQGLWSVGGTFGASSTAQHIPTSTMQMSVRFSYERVSLERKWLRDSLFHLGGYKVDGFAPGTFSSGQLSPSNTGAWSLMPNSFVVVKDVTVKAALSSAEKARVKASQGGPQAQQVSWGPFNLNTNGTRYNEETFELEIPGLQIIGLLNSVLPYSPPQIYQCSPACMNGGECIGINKCSCARGWQGDHCQTPVCFTPCLNGGTCIGPDKCNCVNGWQGDHCQIAPSRPSWKCFNYKGVPFSTPLKTINARTARNTGDCQSACTTIQANVMPFAMSWDKKGYRVHTNCKCFMGSMDKTEFINTLSSAGAQTTCLNENAVLAAFL